MSDFTESLRSLAANTGFGEIEDAADKIELLETRLADMTAEADSWRANARDSGEEARKYKARLAEAEALLRDIYSYAEDQGMETLMDMIDAAKEGGK